MIGVAGLIAKLIPNVASQNINKPQNFVHERTFFTHLIDSSCKPLCMLQKLVKVLHKCLPRPKQGILNRKLQKVLHTERLQ